MASLDPAPPVDPDEVTPPPGRAQTPARRVAVVGGARLHRDVLTLVLDRSPDLCVGVAATCLDELDRLDPLGTIDTAVVVLSDGSGLALQPRGAGPWADRAPDPAVIVGWDTDRRVLVRLLTDSATVCGPGSLSTSPTSDECLSQLTRREVDVLLLLADGASSEVMAVTLGISRNTVRTHVTNLLRKLEVHTRLEAVARTRAAVAAERRRRASDRGR